MPSPVGLCHGTELDSDSLSELSRQKPPGPIAVSNRWFVHLGFMAEAQNVLHGEDCRICHRHHGESDELPVDVLGPDFSAQVPEEPLFVLGACLTVEPASGRVVVVRACIYHTVPSVGVGQIDVHGIVLAKGKEKDLHPREA